MGLMNVLSPVAVPTFFAVSGFLFFRKKRSTSDLWKYVWRVAKLYVIWTLIFLPLVIRGYYLKNMFNMLGLIEFLQNFFFSGAYFHLWFLPALIMAIVFVFYSSKKLSNRSMIILALVLFIVGTLVDTYSFVSPLFNWAEYKAIFLTTRNGIFFGIPFVVIGKLIAEKQYKPQMSMVITSVVLLVLEGIYLTVILKKAVVNMSLCSIMMVPIILAWILNAPNPQIDGGKYRKMSTLIFCFHPIAIFWVGHFIKGYIGTIVVLIVTVLGCYAIIVLSRKFKVLENLW